MCTFTAFFCLFFSVLHNGLCWGLSLWRWFQVDWLQALPWGYQPLCLALESVCIQALHKVVAYPGQYQSCCDKMVLVFCSPPHNLSQEGLSNRINPLAKGVSPAIVLPPYYGRDTGIAKLAGAAPLKEERHQPIWLFQCCGYSGVTAGATPISL